MSEPRRRVVLRASPVRIVIWTLCAGAIIALWRLQSGGETTPVGPTTPRDEPTLMELRGPRAAGSESAPPILRIGCLARSAHLPVLVAVQADLLSAGLSRDGPVDALVATRPADLARDFVSGALDVACVPIRDAVALSLGEGVVVVAGTARGDEEFVLARGVVKLDIARLSTYSVGLLEAPRFDIARLLGGATPGGGAAVRLLPAATLQRDLAAGNVDFTIVPEPMASYFKALTGGELVAPDALEGAGLACGAVLVARTKYVAEHRPALLHALAQLELSAKLCRDDLDNACEFAHALLDKGLRPLPALVWRGAADRITLDSSIPRDAMQRVLDLQPASAAGPPAKLDDLIDPGLLPEAQALLAESLREK